MMLPRRNLVSALLGLLLAGGPALTGTLLRAAEPSPAGKPFRPPAVPLVVHDPYFSIWSPADRLTDAETVHWTGRRHALSSLVRIDGAAYRVMGTEPQGVPALPQTSLVVGPTRTTYEFATEEVRLSLNFTTPFLPDDLDVLTRPVTYITYEAVAVDGRSHSVALYFDASAELTVDAPAQPIVWGREEAGDLAVLRAGSRDQRILARKGDDLRIDWGYLYAAAPRAEVTAHAVLPGDAARKDFATGASLSAADDTGAPRPAAARTPCLAFVLDLGTVGERPVSRTLMLAYDDIWSILFMGERQRPYWRRSGAEARDLLLAASREKDDILRRCRALDEELMRDFEAAGGVRYARMSALAYRQCLASGKFTADSAGMPLFFPKENFSNGCIATVDVIYPMAPLFLLFGQTLAKSTVVPILEYAMSPRWKFPFAPHDLGTYPHATGQVYGGGERTEENQMPVEESGNMLILMAAIARLDGDARFAEGYWPALRRWAEYLREKGQDPENQLCTDDFAGHLAHNVNLSAKAILALGCYARLCDMLGKKDEAASYRKTAEDFVAKWIEAGADGDHYRLAFDRPGTWSQKYNLVWDRILDLKLFPEKVFRTEMDYYRKAQNRYGLPLDNRKTFTKLDWILWTATLTGSREDFEAIANPAHDFLDQSPDRVPMSDWYETKDAKVVGFRARPVVGWVLIKMLDDPGLWGKWAARGARLQGSWAPLPKPPEMRLLVPTAREEGARWRYTFEKPAEGWQTASFDASRWKEGPAGFGTKVTPGATARTEWSSPEIWLRREVSIPEVKGGEVALLVHHDEDVRVYLNGVLAAEASGYTTDYELLSLSGAGKAALRAGRNLLAVHCRQTDGGQYVDVGIVAVLPAAPPARR